ncbi:hypothetical protein [Pseudomonas sp. F3-2]|uniref:hypothetical protein n=1 Tax=Pseudomonas sp. F3-2 TaxID=3141539 RepID=UPI00315D24C1
MNDLSYKPAQTANLHASTLGDVTGQLAKLAGASACCIDLMNNAPSLRAVAFDLLQGFLPRGTRISNPDSIFLNSATDSGVKSLSLTDALLHGMIHGHAFLEEPGLQFYQRHDSVADLYRFSSDETKRITSAVRQLVDVLPARFEGQIHAFWNAQHVRPDDASRTAKRREIITDQQTLALQCEAQIHCATQAITLSEKEHVLQALDDDVPQGGFSINLLTNEGHTWELPLIAIEQPASDEDASAVFLLIPGKGMERIDSLSVLTETLSHRLAGPSRDEHLLGCLPAPLRQQVEQGVALKGTFHPVPLGEPILRRQMDVLLNRQVHDFNYLLTQARNDAQLSVFLDRMEHGQPAVALSDALGYRVKALTVQANESFRPGWFTYADPAHREEYLLLEAEHQKRREAVDSMFTGLESLETFGLKEIDTYVLERLGYSVDPRQVMVSVPDEVALKSGTISTRYKKSLFDFAISGLPFASQDGIVELPAGKSNPLFDFGFVVDLVTQVDVQRRYAQMLRDRYSQASVQRALVHMRDSALALSVCGAVMQGHLRDARSEEWVRGVRADVTLTQAPLRMGSLSLAATGTRFKDAIVFCDGLGSDAHFVLYAPGAPAGKDLFEGSWQQIANEVGGWTATEAGRRYVTDQVAEHNGNDPESFMQAIQLKPSLWSSESVSFEALAVQPYELNLLSLISHKVDRALNQQDADVLGLRNETAFANRRTLAFIDARLEWLDREFRGSIRGLLSYKDFVVRETRAAFDEYLQADGINDSIDPDTLYFDVHNTAYTDSPDFSEYTHLRTLTSLMAEGYSDQYAYRPTAPMYSSVGQNPLDWPLYFVQFVDQQLRKANLGARYIAYLKSDFLNASHPQYAHRRALMGMRTQFQMRRAAISHFLDGSLNQQQYRWLVDMIVGLDEDVLASDVLLRERNRGRAMSPFRLAGHIVQGVYIFRDFNSDDPQFKLLYTPDAPDGVSFRPVTDYLQLLESHEMRSYYYHRVSYKGQPSVGTLYEQMARGLKRDPESIKVLQPMVSADDVITDVYKLYDTMLGRMIFDVDAQTTSTAEQWAEVLYTVVRWTGTILLLPFPLAGIAWGVVTSGVSFFRGAIAYSYGDRATALPYLVFAVSGLLLAGDGVRALSQGTQTILKSIGLKAVTSSMARGGLII